MLLLLMIQSLIKSEKVSESSETMKIKTRFLNLDYGVKIGKESSKEGIILEKIWALKVIISASVDRKMK